MSLYLFLIRHGETEWTKDRRFQGSSDIPLTDRGKKQAAALARCLKNYGIDQIYCSPLSRARQTAEPIAKALKKKIHFDSRIRELGFGSWEGKTPSQLMEEHHPQYSKWCKGKIVTPKNGEKISDFRKRVGNFLSEIIGRHNYSKKVAVVTHGGPIKMIIYDVLKLPFRSLWSFRIETTSISVIGVDRYLAQVYCLNDTAHLPHALTTQPDYMV